MKPSASLMPRSRKCPVMQKSWRPARQARHAASSHGRRTVKATRSPGFERAHGRPDVDHLAERLVPEHQPLAPGGRRAVVKVADLAVGAADADLGHAHRDVVLARRARRRHIDDSQLTLPGKHGHRAHGERLHVGATKQRTYHWGDPAEPS